MKHIIRQCAPGDAPRTIARAVRERVIERLGQLNYAPEASEIFFDRVEIFARNLAFWGATTNLTARPDDPAEIAFHVIDSLMPAAIAAGPDPGLFSGVFGPERRVLDIGSGAGFPGLILAAATRASFTLAESRRRRASFLSVVIAEIGLTNAQLEMTRITPSRLKAEFDLVTARAVGELPRFYEIAGHALRSSGLAMLYVNPSQRLSLDLATTAGLSEYSRRAYTVERDGATVERVLATWRKS